MANRLAVSIATRIAMGLLTLAFVAVGGAGTTYVAMDAQADGVLSLTQAAEGPLLVERLRAEVYATVMESRGLYFARDQSEAAGFAKNLRSHLAQIETDWRQLKDRLPAEAQATGAALDGAMAHFVALRTELARVGIEEGAQAADKLGNNDASRAARESFSKSLDRLADATAKAVKSREAETVASGRHVALILLTVTVLTVALSFGLILWLIRRSVSLPLRRLAAALAKMADGRLADVALPPPSQDEVGGITAAAGVFLEKLIRNRELEASAAAEHAARERGNAAMEEHTKDFSQSISGALSSLSASTEGMRRAAHDMAHAVEQTRADAGHTAAGAEESAGNLTNVASATEELTASVGEIARQVEQAAEAAHDAVSQAATSNATISELFRATGQISDIMRLIASIAGQTNLLALNATIEAARAGDAGKGFAVVASEVKQLAQQTALATEQIGVQVAAIQNATDDVLGAMRGMGAAITRVDEIATVIAAAVQEQGHATREIAANVQVVARQNDSATRAMREVSDVAEGAKGASELVLSAATDVSQVSSKLREEVDQFLSVMRSSASDKRRYERISGGAAGVTLRPCNGAAVAATLNDISQSGAALSCTLKLAPGTEVEVGLPGGDDLVPARVVRSNGAVMAVVFRQDPPVVARVDHAMKLVGAASAKTLGLAAA